MCMSPISTVSQIFKLLNINQFLKTNYSCNPNNFPSPVVVEKNASHEYFSSEEQHFLKDK